MGRLTALGAETSADCHKSCNPTAAVAVADWLAKQLRGANPKAQQKSQNQIAKLAWQVGTKGWGEIGEGTLWCHANVARLNALAWQLPQSKGGLVSVTRLVWFRCWNCLLTANGYCQCTEENKVHFGTSLDINVKNAITRHIKASLLYKPTNLKS